MLGWLVGWLWWRPCAVLLVRPLSKYKITAYLATNKDLDGSLLTSEREAIVRMCKQRNTSGLNGLMHDLYTQACERLKVVESLNHSNLDSARDNLKLTYYKNWGACVRACVRAAFVLVVSVLVWVVDRLTQNSCNHLVPAQTDDEERACCWFNADCDARIAAARGATTPVFVRLLTRLI